jgi:D-alanine-D-alanine ligase-like ATP-grasp enzyme
MVSLDEFSLAYQPCFEVFGLDFMLDEGLVPYLIEFNTNPCYEMSCLILQKVIGRMLQNV